MLGSMMRRAMIGDDAKLSLDFTSTLPAGVTFTRAANTATRINSSGLVETMSADQPRFDHDPNTGSPRGLLIEGQATNVCEQGQYCWGAGTINSWGRSAQVHINSVNGTSGANAVARIDGPDGGSLTGTSIFKDSGSTFVRLNQNVAVVQNTTYTFSAYVRAPSGGNPYIRLAAFNGGTWLNTTGGCTLSSVTITNTGGAGSVFNGVPSGSWVRVWVTFTTQAAQTTATIAFYPDADTSNAATMYCWGSQVETESGPSSVIPTGASQATRNPDICTISGAAFSSWYNASEGTFFAHFRRRRTDNTGAVLSANDNTTAEVIELAVDTVGKFNVTDGGASQVALFRTPFTANTDTKLAGAFKLNDCNIGMNGSIGTTDTTATMPTVDRLFIGRDAGAVPVYLDGHVKVVKFYDARKTDVQVQALTT